MERNNDESRQQMISVGRARFEIVFSDDADSHLSLVTPPLDDIYEMSVLERDCFSLSQHIVAVGLFQDAWAEERNRLKRKEERFSDSAVFHNRLANLHAATGDLVAEEKSLERAQKLLRIPVFSRKRAENLVRRSHSDTALTLFEEAAGKGDLRSRLWLAAFAVKQGDMGKAWLWVRQALSLDAFDYSARLFESAMYLVERRFRESIVSLKVALESKPNSSVGYMNLGFAYLGLDQTKRAFESMKLAVAFNPFNRSALLALADLSSTLEKDADALGHLRYYVEFEQKEAPVWGRLARSLFRLSLFNDCEQALKRQGALQDSSSVWNNLAVCYSATSRPDKALGAFTFALSKTPEIESDEYFLIGRNLCQLLSDQGEDHSVLELSKRLVSAGRIERIVRSKGVADIVGFRIQCLARAGKRDDAIQLGEFVLQIENVDETLSRWILTSLIGSYALRDPMAPRLAQLVESAVCDAGESEAETTLLNNVAFALAEMGRLVEAERIIQRVSAQLHRSPYVTATLGLIRLRQGKVDSAVLLYREAIGLALTRRDKARIRQKLNVELANLAGAGNTVWRRRLEKVATETEGEPELRRFAQRELGARPH